MAPPVRYHRMHGPLPASRHQQGSTLRFSRRCSCYQLLHSPDGHAITRVRCRSQDFCTWTDAQTKRAKRVAHRVAYLATSVAQQRVSRHNFTLRKCDDATQEAVVAPELLRAPSRAVRSRFMDSTRWQGYRPRPDDIIIGTYSKCGTTWVQRIVSMLVFKSAAPRPILEDLPWLDLRTGDLTASFERIEAQTHRRYLKTHLPFDALPVYEGVKFIHVGRDGRDAAMSLHNHFANFRARRHSAVQRIEPG